MAPQRYAATYDPLLSLDCAGVEGFPTRKGRDQIWPSGNLAAIRLRFLQKAKETIKISGYSLYGKTEAGGAGEGGIFLAASRRLEFELRCPLIVWKEIVGRRARGEMYRKRGGRVERFFKDFRFGAFELRAPRPFN